MRIGKLFGTWSWRVASGEFVLIFVGILAALAADDWNTQRQERREELAALEAIRSALASDVTEMTSMLSFVEEMKGRVRTLAEHLDSARPYSQELDPLFGAVYGFRESYLSTAPYEALKSGGLGLISNDPLRVHIVRVYDERFPKVDRFDELHRNTILDLYRPYFLEHFVDLRFTESATPLDPSVVMGDPYFRNLVDYRLAILEQSVEPPYTEALEDARALLAAIETELGGPVR